MMIFLKQQLSDNWYHDQSSIHELLFCSCEFEVVMANAFNKTQFETLRSLEFRAMPSLTFTLNAFDGLCNLEYLYFSDATIVKLHHRFLKPVINSLLEIQLYRTNVHANKYHLIGSEQLLSLQRFAMYAGDVIHRILTPNSITKVPRMHYLQMIRCGIEAITKHSFDHLAKHLRILNLRENELKTLPITLFDAIHPSISHIRLQNNPWSFSCELVEIKRKFIDSIEFSNNFAIRDEKNCRPWRVDTQDTKFGKESCLKQYGTNAIRIQHAMAFRLKIIEDGKFLYVKTMQRSKFYLLRRFRGRLVDCVMATAKYAAIAISPNQPNGVHSICALDDRWEEKLWPLNCMAYHVHADMDIWIEYEWKIMVTVILASVYLTAFVCGTVAGIYVAKRKVALLRGVDRIHLLRNRQTDQIETVIVLPSNWRSLPKLRAIKYASVSSLSTDDGEDVEYTDASAYYVSSVDYHMYDVLYI